MLRFDHSATSEAPPEEVWKLLYDPARFSEWWEGMQTTQVGDGEFVFTPDGQPDLRVPHLLDARHDEDAVVISCLRHDVVFEWRLTPAPDGAGTHISVRLEAPEEKARIFENQRRAIAISVEQLANLAARAP
jgi:uncharacterized protein YndB with AHSA1/START domain